MIRLGHRFRSRSLTSTIIKTCHLHTLPNTFHLPIKTPALQARQTKRIILNNGLKIFLVSDASTPVSGAALSVEIGSWHDEEQYQGQAHFLEHMLFFTTKKYPEDVFDRYISDRQGSMNAYTASDHSLYYFTITPDALQGALDRFSQFFISPLLASNYIERELNAIDQEFRKNVEQDSWRILHVRKELSNRLHPFSGFNTGNRDTIGKISREALVSWFEKNYSANIMNLCVMGKESLDELTEYVKQFEEITNKNVAKLDTSRIPVYPETIRGSCVFVEPLKQLREISLLWEIPHKFGDMNSKPGKLLAYLLGHEGQGSLLAQLKKEGLVESLSAGCSDMGGGNIAFEISACLSKSGLDCRDIVIERIFQGLASFRQGVIPKYLFDELNFMSKVNYEYQQRSSGLAASLCGLLRKEGIETFPERSLFIQSFEPELMTELLGLLDPKTCMVTVIAKRDELVANNQDVFGTNVNALTMKEEKWMGARYGLSRIPERFLERWSHAQPHADIHIPPPNEFIPETLDLVPRPSSTKTSPPSLITSTEELETPTVTLLTDTAQGKLYHHLDTQFLVPESTLIFNIKTPSIRPGNAKALCLADLYVRFIDERLEKLSYPASYAGLGYSVSLSNGTGLAITVSGYSSKTSVMLSHVLETIQSIEFTQHEFDIFKDSLVRAYKNAEKNPPIRQAFERVSAALYPEFCSSKELGEMMEKVTMEDLSAFKNEIFTEYYVESFIGGNIDQNDAMKYYQQVLNTLLSGSKPVASPKLVERPSAIPLSTQPRFILDDTLQVQGNALVSLINLGTQTHKTRALQSILSKLIHEPFYTELRTTQQTGYIVNSGPMVVPTSTSTSTSTSDKPYEKELFLQFSIQSNTHCPRDLLSRVELFLEVFLRDLSTEANLDTNRERFESIRSALLKRLLNSFDQLSAKLRFLNMVAFEEDADFEYLVKRIEAVKSVSFEEVCEFANETLGRGNRKRLAVLLSGNGENRELMYVETSVKEIRSKL